MKIDKDFETATLELLRAEIRDCTALIVDHVSMCRAFELTQDSRLLRRLTTQRIRAEREIINIMTVS